MGEVVSPGRPHDRLHFRQLGSALRGYAIQETSRQTEGGRTSVAQIELLEFSEAPLDAALFNVPSGYQAALPRLYGGHDLTQPDTLVAAASCGNCSTESVLLGGLGGRQQPAVATWGIFALRALAPAQASRFHDVRLDLPVLFFRAALSLGTASCRHRARVAGHAIGFCTVHLSEGDRSASRSRRHHHVMRILAAAQVMTALVLLIGRG
jgi:hypothetical protein